MEIPEMFIDLAIMQKIDVGFEYILSQVSIKMH